MRLRPWLALLLLGLTAPAAAQPTGLSFRHLDRDDGLSSFAVTAVAVDREGVAWLGAPGALDRVDGARIASVTAGASLEDGYVRAIAEDASGGLWAGGEDGLWRRTPGAAAFHPVTFPALGALAIPTLAAHGDTLWIGTRRNGLLRLVDGVAAHHTRGEGHLRSDTVRAVLPLQHGVLVATAAGLSRLSRGRVRHAPGLADVTALVRTEGAVWAGRADGTLVRLGPDLSVRQRAGSAGPPVSALVASERFPGWVWVGARGGGVRLLNARSGALRALPQTTGLPDTFGQAEVLSLAEGGRALWVGTTRGAYVSGVPGWRLRSWRGGAGKPLAVPEVIGAHLSQRQPGVVWAGTVRGGLHRIDTRTGAVDRWFTDPGHPLAVVFDVHETAEDTLWLAGGAGTLWRFRPSAGEPEAFALAPSGVVAHLSASDRYPGHLWVSTSEGGLVRFDTQTGTVAARYRGGPEGAAVPSADVWHTAEADGTLWAATDGDGLWGLDLDTGRAARVEPEGCTLDPTLVSVAAPPQGPLWVGSAEPRLFRIDRSSLACAVYTPADGLPPDGVGGVFVDAAGKVWISQNIGLSRLDPETGAFTLFSEEDGLATRSLYWYARDQAPDGTIAVGGADGLTVFDPLAVPIDETPPEVRLTGLLVDGLRRVLPDGEIRLPHRQNDLTLEFAALDLRQPDKNRYRVRLLGASHDWETTAEAQRRYAALQPGRYTFQVAAAGRDGYWSDPLSVPIRIRPPFWRTSLFWLLVVGIAGGVGYSAHRYRIVQLQRLERTRHRIANDLHDDIGSKISSVALRLDMASAALPEVARDRLATLAETARSVVSDLRDTVWIVDAGHDDLASVLSRMEQFAVDTLGDRGEVHAPHPAPSAPMPMEPRRDLYLLFTEALHNAVRHSGARRVSVRIQATPERVAFRIEDDGAGFDPETARAGRGLQTMRERAEALGGTLAWTPRDGGGTVVSFAAELP